MFGSRKLQRKQLRAHKQAQTRRKHDLEKVAPMMLKASQQVIDFCYPHGNWRGYANMKGLLEAIQPLRDIVRHYE